MKRCIGKVNHVSWLQHSVLGPGHPIFWTIGIAFFFNLIIYRWMCSKQRKTCRESTGHSFCIVTSSVYLNFYSSAFKHKLRNTLNSNFLWELNWFKIFSRLILIISSLLQNCFFKLTTFDFKDSIVMLNKI